MMKSFNSCRVPLQARLSVQEGRMLGARLRALSSVVSVAVNNNFVTIWYRGPLPAMQIQNMVKSACKASGPSQEETMDMAD